MRKRLILPPGEKDWQVQTACYVVITLRVPHSRYFVSVVICRYINVFRQALQNKWATALDADISKSIAMFPSILNNLVAHNALRQLTRDSRAFIVDPH